MLKVILFLSLFLSSLAAGASPLHQSLSIKERLRISLWVEGIENRPKQKQSLSERKALPEEIERYIRKL